LVVALLAVGLGTAPATAQGGVSTAQLKTRDIGSVPVACTNEVFITSLNNDDDNQNRARDNAETLPLRNARGQKITENNLREFVFDVPEATRVYIAEVARIPSNEIVVGTQVRAYEGDKESPFKFGDHPTPVTMYLEGKKKSEGANDIGFEYQYFKDDGTTVCGGFVQGTVVRADASLSVRTGGGTAFTEHNKMLIGGNGNATATVAPANLVSPEWSFDVAGAMFSTPTQLSTGFTAPEAFTPEARMGQDRLRLILTATATDPPDLVIEANVVVNLTAARSLRLQGDDVRERPTGLMDADDGRFDLFNWLIEYDILDQTENPITDSAYAGRQPQARENIRRVLTSPIDAVREQIRRLKHSPNWTNQSDGVLSDRVQASNWDKDLMVVRENGRRLFHPVLRSEGGVFMHVAPPNTHIWELSISGKGIVQATQNRFASTVIQAVDQGQKMEINIRSRYTVVLP
jgi:hypothetical protein